MNSIKNGFFYKAKIIATISLILSIILMIVFLGFTIRDVNKTVEDSFIPLSKDQCIISDEWYTDDWGTWIENESKLLEGLKYFYERTGAQPYVYITGEDGKNYSSEQGVQELSERIYNEKFTDAGHVLLVFREYPDNSGDWYADIYCGNAVAAMLGQETGDIIINNLVKYYEYTSLTDEEFFSKTFETSANQIRDKFVKVSYDKNKSFGINLSLTIIMLILSVGSCIVLYKSYSDNDKIQTYMELIHRNERYINNSKESINEIENKTFKTIKCPSCGANVNINLLGQGKCKYCDIDITKDKSDMQKIIYNK